MDAKNKDALTSRISTIDSLGKEHYDRVYIIGHSLGDADYSVFDAINKDTEVICFYYSEDTKAEMENTLKSLGFQYVMVQNAEIFPVRFHMLIVVASNAFVHTNCKNHPLPI